MSFKAELKVEGQTTNLLNCEYTIYKKLDYNFKPVTRAISEPIIFIIESTDSHFFLEWAASIGDFKSGKIVFYRRDNISKMREVIFTDAKVINYKEIYDSVSKKPLFMEVAMSYRLLTMGSTTQDNHWPIAGGLTEADKKALDKKNNVVYESVKTAPVEEKIIPIAAKAVKHQLKPGTPEHKADRWLKYQNKENDGWSYDRWSKQYDTNMKNAFYGVFRESQYRDALGGESKLLKTPRTYRQVDMYLGDEFYAGQIKTGKVSLTKENIEAIEKDKTLVKAGFEVEHILEKGASKPYLAALEKGEISYHIGSKI